MKLIAEIGSNKLQHDYNYLEPDCCGFRCIFAGQLDDIVILGMSATSSGFIVDVYIFTSILEKMLTAFADCAIKHHAYWW